MHKKKHWILFIFFIRVFSHNWAIFVRNKSAISKNLPLTTDLLCDLALDRLDGLERLRDLLGVRLGGRQPCLHHTVRLLQEGPPHTLHSPAAHQTQTTVRHFLARLVLSLFQFYFYFSIIFISVLFFINFSFIFLNLFLISVLFFIHFFYFFLFFFYFSLIFISVIFILNSFIFISVLFVFHLYFF